MRFCAHKWRCSFIHDEENNTHCKQICLKSLIVACFNLGCAVTLSTNSGSELSIAKVTLWVASKPKIWNFEVKVSIKEDILGLEVSMSDSNLRQIGYGWHQLLEVRPGKFRGEAASFRDIVEEFPSFCQFKHNQRPLFFLTSIELDLGLRAMLYHVNEMRMLHFSQHFCLNAICCFLWWSAGVDFKCIGLTFLAAEVDTR